ncbi:MAG: hypothetical protein AAFQ71_00730 [Planctomycetota bacterium]
MRCPSPKALSAAAMIAASLAGAPLAGAATLATQPAGNADATPQQLLTDFIHFINIGRFDVAGGLGAQLAGSVAGPVEFVELVERNNQLDRFQAAIQRGRRVPQIAGIVGVLDALYQEGRLARARNPDEVARNIQQLAEGGVFARNLATQRLVEAGEYAMPQLIETFLIGDDPGLRVRVRRVMIEMGRDAVIPLSETLAGVDAARQELLIDVLQVLGYRACVPYLAAVRETTSNSRVADAAARAIESLNGDVDAPSSALFAALADAYLAEPSELTSFEGEAFQLAWNYDPGLGLIPTPVRTPVYHEAMAMRNAERALTGDADLPETIALWIAANLRREIETPDGYQNPLYPETRRPAEYFAVVAGADIGRRVLRRAIDDRDAELARDAIAALQQTAGVDTLLGASALGRRPLVESLTFPSRRVRYEAALAVAAAQPASGFAGSERVVPILGAMVREAGNRFAVVLTGEDTEAYALYRGVLSREGFTVLPQARRDLSEIDAAIAEAASIDLVLTDLPFDGTLETVERVRANPRFGVAPVVALSQPTDIEQLRRRLAADRGLELRLNTIDASQLTETIDALSERVSGGAISDDEASEYASASLAALRDLAIAGNAALNVADAAGSLIAALDETSGQTRLDVAEVLAHIGQDRTQVALAEAALDAGGREQVDLLAKVADAARRFGNLIEDRQVRRLTELAQRGDGDNATAAAAVLGSLGLRGFDLVPLLIGDAGQPARRLGAR